MTSVVKTDKLISPFAPVGSIINNNWRVDSGSQITIAPYKRMFIYINGNMFTVFNLVKSGLTGLNTETSYYIYIDTSNLSSLTFNQNYNAYEITSASNIVFTTSVPDKDNSSDAYWGSPDSSSSLNEQRCVGHVMTDNDTGALILARSYQDKTYFRIDPTMELSSPLTNSFTAVPAMTIFDADVFRNVRIYARIQMTMSSGNSNMILYSRDLYDTASYIGVATHIATTPFAYVQINRSDVPVYLKPGEFNFYFAVNQAVSGSATLIMNPTGYDNPW